MQTSTYQIQFRDLGGLDAHELQNLLDGDAHVITPDRPPGTHGDLGLLIVATVLGYKALNAALLVYGRGSTTRKTKISVTVVTPDGTSKNVTIEVDSSETEALSEQAMKQIAAALKVSPADLAGLD
ncbi:VCBS repeat-containing protein [Duganella sp. CF517]|nr:VCBS repeat-containing protein [Duganella sp. CF517]